MIEFLIFCCFFVTFYGNYQLFFFIFESPVFIHFCFSVCLFFYLFKDFIFPFPESIYLPSVNFNFHFFSPIFSVSHIFLFSFLFSYRLLFRLLLLSFFFFFSFLSFFFSSELKFVKKTNQHIQLCAQRLTDEDALTAACFYNLEDDVIETERRSIRMHLLRWNGGVKNVISVKEVLRSESDLRLVEDSILLDTVIESQQLLQHTVSYLLCLLNHVCASVCGWVRVCVCVCMH